MLPLNRRRFLAASAATLACKPLASLAQAVTPAATLTLHTDQRGPRVPENFIGLSYETQQLSDPTFFSQANTKLIDQFQRLSPQGVLRLGGNTSDYGYWKPTPASQMPPRKPREYKLGDPPPDLSYAVTPEAVRNLNDFLRATGWTCLYGINLGTNIPSLAGDEAAFVAKTLGPRLEYFQIGNEADRFATTIRDPKLTGHPWTVDAFLEEWLTMARAILARVPDAMFGLPDVASNAEWISAVGTRLAHDPIHEHVASVSHHYYVGGPPSNPDMTIDRILKADPRVKRDAELVRTAAAQLRCTYRMTEGNTCYRGGKPGVSDVFAAALWSADYALLLASLGYAGVNLHGGDGKMIASGLGNVLPGDEVVLSQHGNPAEHPHPYYAPIAHIGDQYIAEPVSFGLMFAGHFAGETVVPIDFDPGPVNATAYAARQANSQVILAIINKDKSQPLPIDLSGYTQGLSMQATSLTSYTVQLDMPRQRRAAPSAVPPSTASLFFSIPR